MNYDQFNNLSCYEEFEIQCDLIGISKIDVLKEIGHKIDNYYLLILEDGIFNWFDLNGNHIKDIKYNNKYFEIESDGENVFAYSGDNRDNPLIKDREFLLLDSMGDVESAYFYNKNRLLCAFYAHTI